MKPQSPSLVGRRQGRGKARDEVWEGGGLRMGAGVRNLERLEASSTSPCLEKGRDDDQVARWEDAEARWGHYLPTLLLSSAWTGCSCAGSLELKMTAQSLPPPARSPPQQQAIPPAWSRCSSGFPCWQAFPVCLTPVCPPPRQPPARWSSSSPAAGPTRLHTLGSERAREFEAEQHNTPGFSSAGAEEIQCWLC